jgi:hypothetical protein
MKVLNQVNVLIAEVCEPILPTEVRKTATIARYQAIESAADALIASVDAARPDDLVLRNLVRSHMLELRAAVLALWPEPPNPVPNTTGEEP